VINTLGGHSMKYWLVNDGILISWLIFINPYYHPYISVCFGKVHPLYEKNNQNVGQLDQLTPKNHVAQMFETCQAAK